MNRICFKIGNSNIHDISLRLQQQHQSSWDCFWCVWHWSEIFGSPVEKYGQSMLIGDFTFNKCKCLLLLLLSSSAVEVPIAAGTAGHQLPTLDRSRHCRTWTARKNVKIYANRVLEYMSEGMQNIVRDNARLYVREECQTESHIELWHMLDRMPEFIMSDRMPEYICQIDCLKKCKVEC